VIIRKKIEALLKRMTLEEKVGQMTQLAIGMISKGQDQTIQIDPEKLEKPSCDTVLDQFLTCPSKP